MASPACPLPWQAGATRVRHPSVGTTRGIAVRFLILCAACVALPAVAAPTPLQGVPYSVRRGFFTEADIGAFFTVGGASGISNAQTYLQLGVGYDVTEHIELGAHFGLGTSSANCFSGAAAGGGCPFSDSFTLSFVDVTGTYLVRLLDRFYLTPRVAVGYAALDPNPVPAARSFTPAVNAGAGIGVEYATLQDHFTVGADVLFRWVFMANVPTFSIFPRVKYTF